MSKTHFGTPGSTLIKLSTHAPTAAKQIAQGHAGRAYAGFPESKQVEDQPRRKKLLRAIGDSKYPTVD